MDADRPHDGEGELPGEQERVGRERGARQKQLYAFEDLEKLEEQDEKAAALAK
jgi:hypothetical protein